MLNVLKSTGELQPFSEEKLRFSMQRAGVPQELVESAVSHVNSKLYDQIPTHEIYSHVSEFLGKSSHPFSKAKYGIRQAIMDLGPTGYPFEDYICEILKMDGYKTAVRQILQGECVSHEIDIVAEKNNIKSMIECKFHNSLGTRSQVHVSLYTKARFDDIKEKHNLEDAWIITNTKITPDALNYAICSNMKVIAWDYPEKNSLGDLIEKYKLHPITALSTISQNQMQELTQNHVVLARDICKNPSSLDILGLPPDKQNSIVTECQYVYGE